MDNPAAITWNEAGAMLEEMNAGGQKVELKRTSSNKADFTWSFQFRLAAMESSKWTATYGETAPIAIERGYHRWMDICQEAK